MEEGRHEQLPRPPTDKIERVIRLPEISVATCIDPAHLVLTSADIDHGKIILTSICWTLGEKPRSVVTDRPIMTPEIEEACRRACNEPMSNQILAFLGMSGLMTLAKEIRIAGPTANTKYLLNSWQELCATLQIKNIFKTEEITKEKQMRLFQTIHSWQSWIKVRAELRRDLLALAIKPVKPEATGMLRGILDQVIMVLKDFGLKSIYVMEAFSTSNNKAIIIKSVARQAVELKRTLRELREKHGPNFPYLRIFPLEGVEKIYHRNYPDLYYAAISTAIRSGDLGKEGQYIMSNVQIVASKAMIEEYTRKRLITEQAIDAETRENLEELGIDGQQMVRSLRRGGEDEEEEAPRRRRRI